MTKTTIYYDEETAREVEIEEGEFLQVRDGSRVVVIALNHEGGLHVEVIDENGQEIDIRGQGLSKVVAESTVSLDTAPPEEFQWYTVIGTSEHHPEGYTYHIRTQSVESAKERVVRRHDGPKESIQAVIEGKVTNVA